MSEIPSDPQGRELREQLAALAHEQWTGWMRYLFNKCRLTDMGDVVIPKSSALHWQRQMGTPYADLSETEKDSDRDEADRVLAVLRASSAPPPEDESLRVQHARKQGAADGFQQGWHAALRRVREGDAVTLLEELVPLSPASSAPPEIPSDPQERTLADYRPQHDGGCASHMCARCNHGKWFHIGGRCSAGISYDYGVSTCGCVGDFSQPCTCGLDALLRAPPR